MKIFGNKSAVKETAAAAAAALVHFVISFFTDKLVFKPESKEGDMNFFFLKILLLFVLFGLWYTVITALKRLRAGDKAVWSFCRTLIPFAVVFAVYMIAIYPGNWIWDDIHVYQDAINGYYRYWQHFLTSVYYAICLMIIPSAAGIVIVQLAMIALISSYAIETVKRNFNTGKGTILLYIPFFLMPVLYLDSHPLRLIPYAYLDLLFLALFADSYRNGIITAKRLTAMLIVSVLLTAWRTEGIIYMAVFPLLFLVMFAKKAAKWQKICYCVIFLLISWYTNTFQSLAGGMSEDYSKTAFLLPLVPLTERAYKEDDTEFLEAVDKVYSVEILLEGAENGESGEVLYWGHDLANELCTDEEFSEFKSQYIKACVKYFDTFIKERFDTLLSSDFDRYDEYITRADSEEHTEFYGETSISPRHRETRLAVLRALGCYDVPALRMLWQPVVPIILMFAGAMVLLFRKKYAYCALTVSSLMKTGIVFLTAPGLYFMYYFPVYLCGYFGLFMAISVICSRKKRKDCIM